VGLISAGDKDVVVIVCSGISAPKSERFESFHSDGLSLTKLIILRSIGVIILERKNMESNN
jgi:hypothetical protein